MKRQISFGYTSEDLRVILSQMCETGKEALGSMGNDTPLAVLSNQAQHLSSYFKQLFAQVTNPPIDPIRERLVMSLASHVGGSLNLLEESPEHCITLELPTPILSNNELEKFATSIIGIFKQKLSIPTSKPMVKRARWKKV